MSFLCNRLRFCRERGWTPISDGEYRGAWERWGGSVATHPQVVSQLSALAEMPIAYLGWFEDGEMRAAIPVWGRHLALSREALKKSGKPRLFDLGNAEIILPLAATGTPCVRHRARYVSSMHSGRISGLRKQEEQLMLARQPEDYSRKFLYNQRRELRLLEQGGGRVLPLEELGTEEIALHYARLFEKRWGFAVPGKQHLAEVFRLMRPFMFGSCISIQDQPVAIQIIYRVVAPEWISTEYVNAGVDPDWNSLSPGSVLTFVNTQAAWAEARTMGKPLRYSFGRADREYKARWCVSVPVFQTG